jgi:hypothetical protein
MSDFELLNDQAKAVLQIKLDGHVEACVHAADSLNIGVAEALRLAATAFIREFAARGFDRNSTVAVLCSAADMAYPTTVAEQPRRVS